MKTPIWETSAGALAALLNSSTQIYRVELFTFYAPNSSTVIARYTSADRPVTVNGNTYTLGPVITRSRTSLKVGIAVDSLDMTLACDSSVTINGVPLLAFIGTGGLDNARVSVERAYAPAPGSAWVGMLLGFKGRVSDATTSRYQASVKVASDSELLNVMVPRNVFAPGCANTLFDATCGIARTSTAATASGATDATRTSVPTNLTQPNGWFALGWIEGVTGANAGVRRTIKDYSATAGRVTTVQPWPSAVASGDTFKVFAGCDKTIATCTTKFANQARFRGYPYVPAPETVT